MTESKKENEKEMAPIFTKLFKIFFITILRIFTTNIQVFFTIIAVFIVEKVSQKLLLTIGGLSFLLSHSLAINILISFFLQTPFL